MGALHDEGTKELAKLSEDLKVEYPDPVKNEWAGSPFAWILLRRSSRQRGKIGEQLVSRLCKAHGLEVEPSPDSDADRLIGGKRVEIKFSTLWEGGNYVFQQIRNQNYEYLICIGISPFEAHLWIMKKSEIPFEKLSHQHGGAKGQDTWWFSVDPSSVPDWLTSFGGPIEETLRAFKSRLV